MAVSGSKNYSITRADIIEGALSKLGIFDAGDPISGADTNVADRQLNLMVKEWVARGIDIWLRDDITVFLQPNQQSYALGTDKATLSFVETTLSAAAASGATLLNVTSTTGMAVADNIGIKVDDNTIHWTTIATIPSSTSLTITTGLDDAAAASKKVYAYTTTAGRPQKVIYAFRRDKNGLDTPVEIVGEQEYQLQSNKGSTGPPIEVWYRPTMTTGTLHVWPTNGGANWDKLILVAQYMPDDFDSASDNPQFPIEWGSALIWNLAAELGPDYGVPQRERQDLRANAEFKLNEVLAYDVENASVIFFLGDPVNAGSTHGWQRGPID